MDRSMSDLPTKAEIRNVIGVTVRANLETRCARRKPEPFGEKRAIGRRSSRTSEPLDDELICSPLRVKSARNGHPRSQNPRPDFPNGGRCLGFGPRLYGETAIVAVLLVTLPMEAVMCTVPAVVFRRDHCHIARGYRREARVVGGPGCNRVDVRIGAPTAKRRRCVYLQA